MQQKGLYERISLKFDLKKIKKFEIKKIKKVHF